MTVRGIGGFFFKAADPDRLSAWYAEHLGLKADETDGVVIGWRDAEDPARMGQTVWSPFPGDTTYFDPSSASWMLNFRVENLEATMERLTRADVQQIDDIEVFEYGKFGWVLDPEGNKVELWEPPREAPFPTTVPSWEPGALTGEWACPPGTTYAAADDLSERQIVLEREVERSVDELWAMWTTSEGMGRWWVEESRIELRVGGPFELYFDEEQPDGMRGSEGCRVLSFLPRRMLSFTWNSPPPHEYTRPRHTHVVVEFEATAEQGALVRLTHLGWPRADWEEREEAWSETYAYFEGAWERVLDLL